MKVLPEISGTLFRAVSLQYYQKGLSPKGARLNAGRFNRTGTSAVYLAFDELTAIREYHGSNAPTPLVLLPVDIKVQRVVDITGDLSDWDEHWRDWQCDWRAALSMKGKRSDCSSWKCSDDVLAANAGAIKYPSLANHGGQSLAFYNEDAVIGTWDMQVRDPMGSIAAANPLGARKA